MLDFTAELATLETLATRSALYAERLKKAQERNESAAKSVRDQVKKIADAIRPILENAVEKYNKKPYCSYLIDAKGAKLSINYKLKTFSLWTSLRFPSGSEPDEDLDLEDTEKIASALKKVVDPLLKRDKIPLRLASISVPASYYPK